MDSANDVTTPLSTLVPLTQADGFSSVDSIKYHRFTGVLQYLSLTWLDISFTVNKLSHLMHCPTIIHQTTTKRLLRYLKNTIFYGITLCTSISLMLTNYSDADWVGNLDDCSSTFTYFILLNTDPVLLSSKKQYAIAQSSIEVEYQSLTTAVAKPMWLFSLFQELKFSLSQPPLLLCDNLGVIHLNFNLFQH